MLPPTTIVKPAGGVLPISAAQTQSNGATAKASPAQARSKIVIRRLAPGLTQSEFQDALGEEWVVGSGKVDWMLFRPGKVSKDLANPSRPSRVYLQVTHSTHLDTLAEKVRNTPFIDARNTAGDTVLIGPPSLEFAPYGRVPANKKRNDARQGLIDQDPEFIQFLESLTNPISKPTATDSLLEHADRKLAAPLVTPLIQHLREKKAAKEAAREKSTAAKTTKHTRQGSKNDNVESKVESEVPLPAGKDTAKSPEKKQARVAKIDKAMKIISKPAKTDGASVESKNQTASRANPQIAKVIPEPTKPNPETTTKKADAVNPGAAAARMLQRDLGIRGGRGGTTRRGGRQAPEQNRPVTSTVSGVVQAITTEKNSIPTPVPSKPSTSATPDVITQPLTPAKPPTAPAIMKRNVPNKQPPVGPAKANFKPTPNLTASPATTSNLPTPAIASPTPTQTVTPTSNPPQPPKHSRPSLTTPTSTKAFLKHANPSQGITEPLLLTALSAFGAVTTVEIDKRKGFAYVEFADPESLGKAIAGSPVKVAQGSVQVLERKDRVGGGAAAGRVGAGPVASAAAADIAAGIVAPVPAVGVGRGVVAARGAGGIPGRGGANIISPPIHPQAQQQQLRGGRGGAARGRGGMSRGNAATTVPPPSVTSTTTTAAPQAAISVPSTTPATTAPLGTTMASVDSISESAPTSSQASSSTATVTAAAPAAVVPTPSGEAISSPIAPPAAALPTATPAPPPVLPPAPSADPPTITPMATSNSGDQPS